MDTTRRVDFLCETHIYALKNYTDIGFKKIKAPPEVWNKVKKFWDANKDKATREKLDSNLDHP